MKKKVGDTEMARVLPDGNVLTQFKNEEGSDCKRSYRRDSTHDSGI